MKTQTRVCPNNHELHLMTSLPFKCAMCTKGFMGDRERWACKECGYTVCNSCIEYKPVKGASPISKPLSTPQYLVGH